MPIKILLAIITLLLSFSLAGAEMYKWVDESGVVTFKDTPPPASKKPKKVKVYNDGYFAPAPLNQTVPETSSNKSTVIPSSQPSTPKKERFAGTVELYVTDWCGYCKQAQNYMKSRNIPYVAYDIEKDSAAKQRHKELGGRGVPLIIIGPNKISGFSAESLEYYLNNSK